MHVVATRGPFYEGDKGSDGGLYARKGRCSAACLINS
jgi:hypothetical protein